MKASNPQTLNTILVLVQELVIRLSSQLKKQITLFTDVEDFDLPNAVLNALKDPLLHAVRNACDHGIESQGVIVVRAYLERGQAVVEIVDDGQGLNTEAIRKCAVANRLLTRAQAQTMSDSELHALVFVPGFSTAGKVTEISGRGIGMETVRAGIESIGGVVNLATIRGQQTSIQFRIPLHADALAA